MGMDGYRKEIKKWDISWESWGGTFDKTTNNRMEMCAMIDFLKFCPKGKNCIANIYSDSTYVLGNIIKLEKNISSKENTELKKYVVSEGLLSQRVTKNKCGELNNKNYWKAEYVNSDLLYELHQILLGHHSEGTNLYFAWVRGHKLNEGNIRADELSHEYKKYPEK
jgi:ribonuclease HI